MRLIFSTFVLIATTVWGCSAFAMWEVEGCSEFVVEVPVLSGDCLNSDETDEAHNVCLEAAGFPVSTSPQLLKMMENRLAEETDSRPLEADLERAWSEATQQFEIKYTFQIAKPQKRRPLELMCSVFGASCDEAPYIPTLELPVSTAFASVDGEEERRYIEPVSFDVTAQNDGLSRVDRPYNPLVPPPDRGSYAEHWGERN